MPVPKKVLGGKKKSMGIRGGVWEKVITSLSIEQAKMGGGLFFLSILDRALYGADWDWCC